MQRKKRARVTPYQARENGYGRKNPTSSDQLEAGALAQAHVLGRRSIAGVFRFRRGADQATPDEKVDTRLQVGEVRDRNEQFTARLEDTVKLSQRTRLIGERQVLEHVEAQRAIEGCVRVRQRRQRPGSDP